MWETRVRFLGWEDPLKKEMAIHSSTLAWKIPWTEEPDRLQSMVSQRVGHDLVTKQQQKREMTEAVGVQQPGKKAKSTLVTFSSNNVTKSISL